MYRKGNIKGDFATGKTVIITGASRGIGAAAAKLFAENNYNVVINYNNSEKKAFALLNELKDRGFNAVAFKADVTDREAVKRLVEYTIRIYGGIDVLVNNAGVAQQKLFGDITMSDYNNIMDINFRGVFNFCQLVLPYMINMKKGKIINISSIWGITGASCEVLYSASKAAVIGFTKALAKELGPSNIQVNCIAPGVIDTEMNANLTESDRESLIEETPLMRFGKASDIAESILFLASEKADFITGQILSPNGGFVI